MKKFLAFILIAMIVMTSVFAGGASETTTAANDNGKEVVRIWTKNRHDANFWKEKVAEYNQTNEHNIEVVYEVFSDNYTQTIDMAFQTNEAPEIMKFDNGLDKYYVQGKYADFNTLMDDEMKAFTSDLIFPGFNEFDGKVWHIGNEASCCRLFYNTAIFERLGLEVPTTLDEMVACAQKITKELSGEGIYGFACNLKSPASGLQRSLRPQVELSDGIRDGYDFATGTYNFDVYRPYLEAWQQLIDVAFPGCESLDIDPLRSQFAAGKIGMYISFSHAEPGVYKNQFPMAEGQDWGCAELPTDNGRRDGRQSFNSTPSYVINAEANVDAAYTVWAELLMDKKNLAEHYEQSLGITVFPEVSAMAKPDQKYIDYPALLRTDEIAYPATPDNYYAQDFIIDGPDLFRTFGAIIFRQMDIDAGIKALNEKYNKANEKIVKNGLDRLQADLF